MAILIQVRRGTAAAWTAANTILAEGEQGLETDTGLSKFGDGVTAWNALPYTGSGASSLNELSDVTIAAPATGHLLRHDGTDFKNVLGSTHFAAAAHAHPGADITSGTVAPARLGTGSGGATKFLREDSSWQTVASGGASALDELSDVVVSAPAAGQTLRHNGTSFVNSADAINVKDFGAIGDGASHPLSSVYANLAAAQVVYPFATALTQEIDYCAIVKASNLALGAFGAENASANAKLNRPIYFPGGSYQLGNDTWYIRYATGAHIYGDGRLVTTITSNAVAAQFDGMWYSRVEGIGFATTAGVTAVDLDGHMFGASRAEQACTFKDCIFQAGSTSLYAFAICRLGESGAQGSENMFINCHWFGSGTGQTALLYIYGYNALQNSIMGGNFQVFGKHAIQCNFGSVEVYSVGFQSTVGYTQILNDGYDIDASAGGAYAPVTVIGCRTESLRFYRGNDSQPPVLIGNLALGGTTANWAPSLAYSLNAILQLDGGLGKFYRVSTAGTSGAVEPVWPSTGTVTDGTVVWTQVDVAAVTVGGAVLLQNRWSGRAVNVSYIYGNTTKRVAASYSATWDDEFILCDTTAGNITVTLPEDSYYGHMGKRFIVKKATTDANTVTVRTAGLYLDDNAGTHTVIAGGSKGFVQVEYAGLANGENQAVWIIARNEIGGGGGGATNLDGLTDVVITTPAVGNILRHNGTNFVNTADSIYAPTSHAHAAADITSGVFASARIPQGPIIDVKKDYGAVGNGIADDTTAIQNAINAIGTALGGTLYFPAGTYKLTAALVLLNMRDIAMIGAGRYSTKILQTTTNTPAVQCNGLWYSHFEGLRFETNISTTNGVFECDGNYDGTNTLGVQANTFKDCLFGGNGLARNAFNMVRQGGSAGQGSENLFLNCHFSGVTEYCYTQSGFNAIANTFIGGDMQSFGKGGIFGVGSVHVMGTSFESTNTYTQILNDGFDIDMSAGGVDDKVSVTGVRSESLRFYRGSAAQVSSIRGFSHVPAVADRAVAAYALNAVVRGTTAAGNLKLYRVTTAGTTSGAAPVWPETGTVTDGTVVWTFTDFNVLELASGSVSDANIQLGGIKATSDAITLSQIGFRRKDPFVSSIGTYLVAGSNPIMENCYYEAVSGGARSALGPFANALNSIDKISKNIGDSALVSISGAGGGTSDAIGMYRGNGNRGTPILNWWDFVGGIRHTGFTYSQITTFGTTANGMLAGVMVYCTDGTPGSPLTSGGTGCVAVFQNGAWVGLAASGGGGGSPGGSDTQLQFNDASAFGGDAGLTYNKTTNVLTNTGGSFVSAGGTITASTPALSATQIWNNAAVAFKAIFLNVTQTASDGFGSALMDLQIGGSSQFFVSGASNRVGIGTGAPNSKLELDSGELRTAYGKASNPDDYYGSMSHQGGGSGVDSLGGLQFVAQGAVAGAANHIVFAKQVSIGAATTQMVLRDSGVLSFGAVADNGLFRNAAGVLEINNGTAGTFRDLKLRNVLATEYTFAGDGTVHLISALDNGGVAGSLWFKSNTLVSVALGLDGVKAHGTKNYGWAATTVDGVTDTALSRNAAGVVEINNGTAGTFRDLRLRTVLEGAWNGTAIAAAYLGAHVHSAADITSGILASAQGGNGNGFFAVAGPATSTKTFTLPNSSQTLLHDASTAAGDLAGTYPNPTIKASVSLTTPVIGVATGTSLAATGAITSSGTAGIGYATGAGGTVTQSPNKTSNVTLSKITGAVTMSAGALAAATIVSFTLTNTLVAATDTVVITHASGGTAGAYTVAGFPAAGSIAVSVRNNTAASLSEAIVLRVTVIKSVSA